MSVVTFKPNANPETLDALCDRLTACKLAEHACKLERERIEAEIADHPDVRAVAKDEGTAYVGRIQEALTLKHRRPTITIIEDQ